LRLAFITQQVDPGHPALAPTVPMVAALAARVDELVVIADAAVPHSLPANCRVRSFRAGLRFGRGLRFEAAVARELRGLRHGAVVAHMCPVYAALAAPAVRPLGIPLVLWFAHWRASRLLVLAERFSTAVVTVDRSSFPMSSRKLHEIGHGIDVSRFQCGARAGGRRLRLIALGRYSPAKGLAVVLRAVAATDAELTAYGPASTPEEQAHREELERLVDELGVRDRVRLEDPVPYGQVPSLFAEADLLVNNMRPGAPDKVVYEAGAACLPVMASNPTFEAMLPPELRFIADDPTDLADRLRDYGRLDARARSELGRRLREEVAARHSVEHWAEGVLAAAGWS
jgi:glycosyltransferase involved in cell wall biosynthesis